MGDSTRNATPRLQVTAHSQVAPRRVAEGGDDALMRLQREAGNAAVSELLSGGAGAQVVAREAAPVVARDAAPAGGQVAQVSGKQIDAYLIANSVLKPYIASKMEGGMKAENAVQKDNAADFKKAWVSYAMGSTNPQTGKNYTQAEAEAKEPTIHGFLDGSTVHVHETRGDTGTTLHESLHFYSDPSFREAVGYSFNEGVTEHFTHKVADANKIAREYHFFQEYFAVDRVVMVSSEQKLAEAYFKNDVASLAADVDAAHGEGMWDRFMALMQGNKPQEAGNLIRNVPTAKATKKKAAK